MAAGRSLVKNGVRQINRWPSLRDIMFYNDEERRHLQSDRERKRYKQVYKITPIFSVLYVNFGTFSDITLVFVVITFPLTANL